MIVDDIRPTIWVIGLLSIGFILFAIINNADGIFNWLKESYELHQKLLGTYIGYH